MDSLRCVRPGGVVCMTGTLGGAWEFASFQPMGQIPSGVRLTSCTGGASDISREELQSYVSMVEGGELTIRGSYVGFMDREVLGPKSPLFGRRTAQIHLQPFGFREARQFHPEYSLAERLEGRTGVFALSTEHL